jgi:hypothetical protein
LTIARLLEAHRGVRNNLSLPRLTQRQILRWAAAHHDRAGSWPSRSSGTIHGTAEGWHAIDAALMYGYRGLPGGDSLAKLLARCRGVRNVQGLPPLTFEQIRAWAEAHRRRTGNWPAVKSGSVEGSRGETWSAIDQALRVGNRGLPGGSSLYKVLSRETG